MSTPKPPEGLGAGGRKLWRAILRDYELGEHEMLMLREAAHTADTCEALQALIDEQGPTVTNHLGGLSAHPALRELRQQRLTLARLIVCLRVPLGDEDAAGGRTQYRGIRGVYTGGGAA
jgi:hypothetical protein